MTENGSANSPEFYLQAIWQSVENIRYCTDQVQNFVRPSIHFIYVVSGPHIVSVSFQTISVGIVDAHIAIVDVIPSPVSFYLAGWNARNCFFGQARWAMP